MHDDFAFQYFLFVAISALFLMVGAAICLFTSRLPYRVLPENQFVLVDDSFDRFTVQVHSDFRSLSSSRRWARVNPLFEPLHIHNGHVIAWKWHLQETRPPQWWAIRGVCWIDAWGGCNAQ